MDFFSSCIYLKITWLHLYFVSKIDFFYIVIASMVFLGQFYLDIFNGANIVLPSLKNTQTSNLITSQLLISLLCKLFFILCY